MTHGEKLRAEIGNRFVGTDSQSVFQATSDYLEALELRIEKLEAQSVIYNYCGGHISPTNDPSDDGGQPFCDDATAL